MCALDSGQPRSPSTVDQTHGHSVGSGHASSTSRQFRSNRIGGRCRGAGGAPSTSWRFETLAFPPEHSPRLRRSYRHPRGETVPTQGGKLPDPVIFDVGGRNRRLPTHARTKVRIPTHSASVPTQRGAGMPGGRSLILRSHSGLSSAGGLCVRSCVTGSLRTRHSEVLRIRAHGSPKIAHTEAREV